MRYRLRSLRINRHEGGETLRAKHPGFLIIESDSDSDAGPARSDNKAFIIYDVTRIYGAVEIKLMGVLVEQPLGITVFTVDYYEGILSCSYC